MKLVLPLGRDKMVSAADFGEDIVPYGGCACSYENEKWQTAEARRGVDIGGALCGCQCSYGNENLQANSQLGFN